MLPLLLMVLQKKRLPMLSCLFVFFVFPVVGVFALVCNVLSKEMHCRADCSSEGAPDNDTVSENSSVGEYESNGVVRRFLRDSDRSVRDTL